jgi:hypothetical protein
MTRVIAILTIFNRLDYIARFYRTDKSSLAHDYSPHYARHLGSRRFRRNLLLEIGVGGYGNPVSGGQSLRTWRDYLPRSTIVGIDIEDKDLRCLGNRVHVVRADQTNHHELAATLEQFGAPDIVIDDGSHVGEHVVATFQFLFPRMKAGGVYVIEDLCFSFVEHFGGSTPPSGQTGIGLLHSLAEAAQARDPTFKHLWGTDPPAPPIVEEVAAVHIYPGIGFVEKAVALPARPLPRRPLGPWYSDGR